MEPSLTHKTMANSPARMGRPPLNLKLISVRLAPEILARIDALVGKRRRPQFIRGAVEEALERREKGKP